MPKAQFKVPYEDRPVLPPMADSDGGLQLRYDTGETANVLHNVVDKQTDIIEDDEIVATIKTYKNISVVVPVYAGGWKTLGQPLNEKIDVEVDTTQAIIETMRADKNYTEIL